MLIRREITAVQQLVQAYIYKYDKIGMNAKDMDICLLDRACADADGDVGYIRKIIVKITYIVQTTFEKYNR